MNENKPNLLQAAYATWYPEYLRVETWKDEYKFLSYIPWKEFLSGKYTYCNGRGAFLESFYWQEAFVSSL